MANEKRLIDANAFREFLEVIRMDYIEEDTLSSEFAACLIETVQDEYLALAPTVDAVEVVRCKDCKWYNPRGGVAGQKTIICSYQSGDFFCSYGERREDGGC